MNAAPKVISAFPPNYNVLRRKFPWMIGRAVYFAYGGTIYNPKKAMIGKAKMAHETVHCVRQGNDPEGWWQRYIDDREFRLEEEVLAHRAEWKELQKHINNDRLRRTMLRQTALHLASPLYGSLVTEERAVELISSASYSGESKARVTPEQIGTPAYDIKVTYGS